MGVVNTAKIGFALQINLPEASTCIKATAKKPFDVTISGGKAKAVANFVAVHVVEPEGGFIVKNVRDGQNPGELVVTLVCAEDEYAPAKIGNLVLGVSRKNTKTKQPQRANPTGALTTATPYVIE